MMTPKNLALLAAHALEEKKGIDIRILRVTDVSTLADHFLICTGSSNTHVNTLCDAVEEAMENAGEQRLSREGHRSGTWVLLDYGSLVVHVFTNDTRKFYDLERLWADAQPVEFDKTGEDVK